jgi:hypothetical protein
VAGFVSALFVWLIILWLRASAAEVERGSGDGEMDERNLAVSDSSSCTEYVDTWTAETDTVELQI